MAQTPNVPRVRTPTSPANVTPDSSQGLLVSCKGTVYTLRNKSWEPLFGRNVYRLQLVRQAPGKFLLLVLSEQPIAIKANIVLRYNTVFKVMKQNFFTLLDNGVVVWGFDVVSQAAEAQTFAVVIQNTLTSLKESHNKANRPSPRAQQALLKQVPKGEEQVYLNNICLTLSDAISRGNEQFASDLAKQLAAQKALVRVRLDEPEIDHIQGARDNKINLKIQVEDVQSNDCSFWLNVAPQITISQLQKKVEEKYRFPVEIQRWVIGKRLAKPNETLLDCGIKTSGSTLFLYLISKTSAAVGIAPRWPSDGRNEGREINRTYSQDDVSAGLIHQGLPNEMRSVSINSPKSLPNLSSVRAPPEPAFGWTCPVCTFRNSPLRPGCEMCSERRPEDFRVPQDYVPNDEERRRLELEQANELLIIEAEERKKRLEIEERDRNYQRLMSLALRQPLIENHDEFDCPICFDTVLAGDGVVLRECLHNFCKECLREHIKASEEAEVQCPFDNGEFACHDVITTQEIQELLNEQEFEKFLQRSLATAENQAANSFHCRTPNCRGWCIYDDEVNDFDCPVCNKRNCLTCKAIHFPVNCKEYQDDLKRNAANDEAARKTQEYLEQMLKTKDGMRCPVCGIILVKKDGCDWMKCSMCKTEICWAVRGPRWGPGGPGDTSGGCKCRVNNIRCHPQCRNCH